jgi:hypothetical protein
MRVSVAKWRGIVSPRWGWDDLMGFLTVGCTHGYSRVAASWLRGAWLPQSFDAPIWSVTHVPRCAEDGDSGLWSATHFAFGRIGDGCLGEQSWRRLRRFVGPEMLNGGLPVPKKHPHPATHGSAAGTPLPEGEGGFLWFGLFPWVAPTAIHGSPLRGCGGCAVAESVDAGDRRCSTGMLIGACMPWLESHGYRRIDANAAKAEFWPRSGG